MATSLPQASSVGILANGTDQTSNINTVLSNSNYAGILFDYSPPAAVTISGTVTATGKVLQFINGSTLTGSGTVTGGILQYDEKQKIADSSVTLNPDWVPNGRMSVYTFGAVATTGSDQQALIQKVIDTTIANEGKFKNVYFPPGTYRCDNPLIVQVAGGGGGYGQTGINLVGDSSFWELDGEGSAIDFSHNVTDFGIGIQNGKGNKIKNLKVVGGFTPPSAIVSSNYSFYTASFASYTDGSSRDDGYSPYAGIVIDPFGPSAPTGGGYPGLSSYYKGGSGGSTGIDIEDVLISNFVVGFITSPNGQTSNAELIRIVKIQFKNVKVCLVGCQAQEKMNSVKHMACWGSAHSILAFGPYGAGSPGNWYIEDVNIAGLVNTLVYERSSGGYFPLYIKNVYGESIGQLGNWTGTMSDCLENSIVDFVEPSVSGALPDWVFNGQLTFKNCSFRYYGTNYRTHWNGICKFVDCVFEDIPYVFSDQATVGNLVGVGNTVFEDCWAAGMRLGRSKDIINTRQSAPFNYCYGNYRILGSDFWYTGKEDWFEVNNYDPVCRLYTNPGNQASSITISSSGGINYATVTPYTTADLVRIKAGYMVTLNNEDVLGIVDTVGVSTYTVKYVPASVANGSYGINILYNLYMIGFMGSVTSGSPTISSVIADPANDTTFASIAQVYNHGGCLKIIGFLDYGNYEQGALITAYDSSLKTITMDRNAYTTGSNIYFSNTNAVKSVYQRGGDAILNTELFQKGGYWGDCHASNGGNRVYIVTASGYYSGTPQATWTELT